MYTHDLQFPVFTYTQQETDAPVQGDELSKRTSLSAAVTAAEEAWLAERQAGSLTAGTTQGYTKNLKAFYGYAQAHGVYFLNDVDGRLCRDWIDAPLSAASQRSRSPTRHLASGSTRRGRQSALRRAAKLWLELGMLVVNPVPDEVIRRERVVKPHPLTPPEVAHLRLAGRVGPRDTLRPAMVEAGLAGASQQEIASLVVASFDSGRGSLSLPGTRRTRGRQVLLGPHGVAALTARIADLKRSALRRHLTLDPATAPLLLRRGPDTSDHPPQLVARNLQRALIAAGVNRPDVTAGSIQVFAANACYAVTNRVENVAELLGFHSLDGAMAKIDHQWQSTWADHVRALDER